MSETFKCHEVEWFEGDSCLVCEGKSLYGKPASYTTIAFQAGEVCERERILNLLGTLSHDYDVPARDNSGDMLHVANFCTACKAVALIKGEK